MNLWARSAVVGLVLEVFLVPIQTAQAYIPPSAYILERIIQPRDKIKRINIKTKVRATQGDEELSYSFVESTTIDFAQKTIVFRAFADAGTESGPLLYFKEKKLGGAMAPLSALWLDNRTDEVTQALLKKHVPIRTESALSAMRDELERRASEVHQLKSYNKMHVWLLGSTQKDPASGELWVQADTFLPLRMVWALDDPKLSTEIQFDQIQFIRGTPYPGETRFFRAGERVLVSTLVEFIADPPAVKSKADSKSSGFTDDGKNSNDSLRELIEFYFESVR